MAKFVALLRAVNVGGTQARGNDLVAQTLSSHAEPLVASTNLPVWAERA